MSVLLERPVSLLWAGTERQLTRHCSWATVIRLGPHFFSRPACRAATRCTSPLARRQEYYRTVRYELVLFGRLPWLLQIQSNVSSGSVTRPTTSSPTSAQVPAFSPRELLEFSRKSWRRQ